MSGMGGASDASQRDRVHPAPAVPGGRARGWSMWTGWIVFAAVLLILAGLLQVIEGFLALFDDDYYVVASTGLVVGIDYTVWGIVHLLVGTLACLIGIGLMYGNMVARGAAVVLAGFSAVANLVFLSAAPAWSLLLIGIDVVVIYAVVVHGGELERRS